MLVKHPSLSARKALAARTLAVSVLAAGAWLPAAPQAAAQAVDATCAGNATVTYTPGVTFPPKQTTVSFSGTAAPCTSPTMPAITAATLSGSGTGILGCLEGSFTATGTLQWNNGTSSQVTFSSTIDARPDGIPVIVATGDVTSGTFAGDTAVLTITLLDVNPFACLSPTGVTQTQGPIVLTLAHV